MNTLTLLLPLAWRSLWRNPRRTLVTLAVVGVGLYSILVLGALMQAWAQSSRDTQLDLLTGSGQIHARGYLNDPTVARRMSPPSKALLRVLNGPDIPGWVARVRVPAVVQSEYRTLPVTLVGVDPARERRISTVPEKIARGVYLSDRDDPGIVIGRHLAKRLNTGIGKRVVLMAQAGDGRLAQRAYRVIGLFAGSESTEDSFAFTGIATAQQMLNIGDDISEISFMVGDGQPVANIIARLQDATPDDDVEPWTRIAPLTTAMDGFMRAFVYVWLWIMFVFMAIGIINTQLMAVFERVREFGLLQALGMRPRLILTQVLLESALLVGVGVILGLAAAGVTIAAFHGGISLSFLARGADYFGAGHMLYPQLAPGQSALIAGTVWALGVFVTLWPARRAAHANPVEAMRNV